MYTYPMPSLRGNLGLGLELVQAPGHRSGGAKREGKACYRYAYRVWRGAYVDWPWLAGERL